MNKWNNPANEPYKVFFGENFDSTVEMMPKLICEGRVLISPSLLFWRRLETLNEYLAAERQENQRLAQEWKQRVDAYWNNSVSTSYSLARHPDKGIIIVPNADFLYKLNPGTRLSTSGAATMPGGMFETLEGHHYSLAEFRRYSGREMTEKEAPDNPLWEDFIPDQDLRRFSVANIFARGRESGFNQMMGIYFPEEKEKEPIMNLWCFNGTDFRFHAQAGNHLRCEPSHLIGILEKEAVIGDVRRLQHIIRPK